MEKDQQEVPPEKTKLRNLLVAILIIAIIVISIYVFIGVFTFGLPADEHWPTKAVAATARHVGSNIVVTWQGGPDNAQVTSYNITVWNTTGGSWETIVVHNTVVGNTTTVAGIGAGGARTHVVVVVSFTDGSQQVVLDTYV